MKTAFLGLLLGVFACGLAAKPLTFTFEEYQVDPTAFERGQPYPIERLAGLTPTVWQSVELSAEGRGKASASLHGSTTSVAVRVVSVAESRYQFTVTHEFISAYADGVAITSARETETSLVLKVGEPLVVGGVIEGAKVDGERQAHVIVVRLTE